MTPEALSSESAVLLLIDHQTRSSRRSSKPHPASRWRQMSSGSPAPPRPSTSPPSLTTSKDEGENGPLLPALKEVLPEAYANRIDLHGIIDSLADPAVVEMLRAIRRRQRLTAGIGTEVCGVALALHAHRDGDRVTFVADACGSATAIGHDISLRRLEQQAVTLTTTAR
jgi:hypothetical protein